MQPRWISLIEASVNVVVGLLLSFLLQLVLFEAMAIAASIGQSLVLTLAFAVLSLIRSYVLRRLFNRHVPEDHPAVAHRSGGSRP